MIRWHLNQLLLLREWLINSLLRRLSILNMVYCLLSQLRLRSFYRMQLSRIALSSDTWVAVLAWRLAILTSVCMVLWWAVTMARIVSTMTWTSFIFRILWFFMMDIAIRHDSVILTALVTWLLLLAVVYYPQGAILHLVGVSVWVLVMMTWNIDDALAYQSTSSFTLRMWRWFIWKPLLIFFVIELFLMFFENLLSHTRDFLVAKLTNWLCMRGLVGCRHATLGCFQRWSSTSSSNRTWVSILLPFTSLSVWNIGMMMVLAWEYTLKISV